MNSKYVEIYNLLKAHPNPYGEDFRVVEEFDLDQAVPLAEPMRRKDGSKTPFFLAAAGSRPPEPEEQSEVAPLDWAAVRQE